MNLNKQRTFAFGKKIALVLVTSGFLMASTENVLETLFNGSFECKDKICISNNIIIDEKKGQIKIENARISLIDYPTSKNKISSKKECNKIEVTLPFEECLIEENKKRKQEKITEVTSLIKEMNFKNIVILNKENGETIRINKADIKKSGYLSISKNQLTELKMEDIIINSHINIEGLTLEADPSRERLNNFINTIFQTDSVENKQFKIMYSKIVKEFLKENKIEKDIHFGIKSELEGTDLKVILSLASKSNKIGALSGNIKFNIKNIKRNLKMFNLMNKKSNEEGFGSLMALSQGILLKEINLNLIVKDLRIIHNKLLLTDKDYKNNYEDLKNKKVENINKLDSFYRKALLLSNNSLKIKIKNVNNLNIMMILMSLTSNNVEQMINIETDYN